MRSGFVDATNKVNKINGYFFTILTEQYGRCLSLSVMNCVKESDQMRC